ncbi:MAG: FAD:protein FMN transferase [Acidobacteriota bacterium]
MGERTLYTFRFRAMGGPGQLQFTSEQGLSAAEALAREAIDEVLRLERKYSRFLPSSRLSLINRHAGRMPVAVDEETVELVQQALWLARVTGGAFDPTMGVLHRAWDFRRGRVPSLDELSRLRPLVGHEAVSVKDGTVFLRREGMELDLGGVGKEYAVDRAAALLAQGGVDAAIVNLAGDLRTVGSRGDGHPWRIGVADPRAQRRCRFAVRLLGGGGVATSGDYERYFVKDGVRYHHLLDARTGYPSRGLASATVVAPTASRAGLLATAAFLLGPRAGRELVEATAGCEAALIGEDGQLYATPGMDRLSDLPGSLYARLPGL